MTIGDSEFDRLKSQKDAIIEREKDQIVLDAIVQYIIGQSSDKVTESLDELLRLNRAIEKEIAGYEREQRVPLIPSPGSQPQVARENKKEVL